MKTVPCKISDIIRFFERDDEFSGFFGDRLVRRNKKDKNIDFIKRLLMTPLPVLAGKIGKDVVKIRFGRRQAGGRMAKLEAFTLYIVFRSVGDDTVVLVPQRKLNFVPLMICSSGYFFIIFIVVRIVLQLFLTFFLKLSGARPEANLVVFLTFIFTGFWIKRWIETSQENFNNRFNIVYDMLKETFETRIKSAL